LSVKVMMVLLKVDWIFTTPSGMFFFSLLFTRVVFGLAIRASLKGYQHQ
jgi:hypothetical protein